MRALPPTTHAVWITKAAIVALAIGFCVVGRSDLLWPVDTWPMYARFEARLPGPQATELELRVVARDGRRHRLAQTDLIPFDRVSAAPKLLASAFAAEEHATRSAARTYLTRLVDHALTGSEPAIIELWRVEWKVDPLALPPLDLDAPVREVLQGSFSTHPATEPGTP